MFPSCSINNMFDSFFGKSVFFCESFWANSKEIVVESDVLNNLFGYFGHWILLASNKVKAILYCVEIVFSIRYILKVLNFVIEFIAVFMINDFTTWTRPNKSLGNYPMDISKESFPLAVCRRRMKTDLKVTASSSSASGDTGRHRLGSSPRSEFTTTNISEIRDIVKGLESNDGFPDFGVGLFHNCYVIKCRPPLSNVRNNKEDAKGR